MIGSFTTQGNLGSGTVETATVSTGSANIAYVVASGLTGNDVALDNLSPKRRKTIIGLRDTYDEIIRKVILRGINSGIFPAVDEKLAGFMIASMITRTRIWYHPQKGVSVPELSDFIFNFALDGLTKGRPIE